MNKRKRKASGTYYKKKNIIKMRLTFAKCGAIIVIGK